MDSVSSETVDSSSAVNWGEACRLFVRGQGKSPGKFTAGTYANYHGPFESIVPFSSRGKGILDKVKRNWSANLNLVAMTCVFLNAFYFPPLNENSFLKIHNP